jgi:hypothetical protein
MFSGLAPDPSCATDDRRECRAVVSGDGMAAGFVERRGPVHSPPSTHTELRVPILSRGIVLYEPSRQVMASLS